MNHAEGRQFGDDSSHSSMYIPWAEVGQAKYCFCAAELPDVVVIGAYTMRNRTSIKGQGTSSVHMVDEVQTEPVAWQDVVAQQP